MTKYRVRAYTSLNCIRFRNNYFKVQQQRWWGWRTVASGLYSSDTAAEIIRELLKAEKELDEMNDD